MVAVPPRETTITLVGLELMTDRLGFGFSTHCAS